MLYQYFANLGTLADDMLLSPLILLGQKFLYRVSTFSIHSHPLDSGKPFMEKRVLNAFYKYKKETWISLHTLG